MVCSSSTLMIFLSTPSARRATGALGKYIEAIEDFYPRPPRGGRPGANALAKGEVLISIHALREEGDATRSSSMTPSMAFLSTPSARRATPLRPC